MLVIKNEAEAVKSAFPRCRGQAPNDNTIAGIRSTILSFAGRIALPLVFLNAGLALIQPCAGQGGTWTVTGHSANALNGRREYTATLLPSGKVLAAAGVNGVDVVATAELYDPALGIWTATAFSMFSEVLLPKCRTYLSNVALASAAVEITLLRVEGVS